MMVSSNEVSANTSFSTMPMLAQENDQASEPAHDQPDPHTAEMVYAEAMQRELEEIQGALDEISQFVIY